MTFRFLLLLVCVVVSSALMGQTITVRDKVTGQPLENIEVLIKETSIPPRFTDRSGTLQLDGLQDFQTVIFRRVGLLPLVRTGAQLRADNYRITLSENAQELEEITVASRRPESSLKVAQPVRVITQSDLKFLSQPTMAEALQQTGKVLVQKSQLGGGSPILRGFEASRVLLVVDGVRMNTAIFRAGHLQNILSVDNGSLERVEVALGPGSVLYGSDALGGVIYMHTLQPRLSTTGTAQARANGFVRYGSAMDEKTGHVDWNIGLRRWAFTTSATLSDFGDLRGGARRPASMGTLGLLPFLAQRENGADRRVANPDPNVQTPTAYRQFDAYQKILFQPSASTRHMLNVQYSNTNDIPRYDRLTETANGNPRFAQWYYGPQFRLMTAYHLTKTFQGGVADELRLVAAYQDVKESRYSRRFNNQFLQGRREQVDVWTLNADLKKALTETHELRYGLEVTHNDVTSQASEVSVSTGQERPLDTRYPNGGSNMQTVAGYVSGTWDVAPRSTFSYGARYGWNRLYALFGDKTFFPFPFDDVTQQSGALTGSLGWVTRLPRDWRVSAALSSGYRVPNVDDLAKVFESVAGTLIVPNPTLKPERTYNLDAGFRKTFGGRVTLEGEGFYTIYNNAITTRPSTLNGQSQVPYNGRLSQVVTQANAAKGAFLYGFDTDLTAELSSSVSVFGGFTFTRGRIRTDSTAYPLDHIPPLFGRGGVRLTLKGFRAEANVLFNGWKRLEDYNLFGEDNIQYATPQGMPAWQTFNLRTSYQINRHLQVQAALENIFDRAYRVFASGINGPGRNLVLTVRGSL